MSETGVRSNGGSEVVTPGAAPGNLAEVDTVFADSQSALEQAFDLGLSREARVLTSSPALLISSHSNVEQLESRLPGGNLKELQRSVGSFSQNLFDTAKKTPELQRFALTIARAGIDFIVTLRKAACLTNEDYEQTRVFLAVDVGDSGSNAILNAPWQELFSESPRFETFSFPVSISQLGANRDPGRHLRWRMQGVEYLGYRLIREVWKFLPLSATRRQALIGGDNELLWDTAFHLGINGVALRSLPELQPPVSEELTMDGGLPDRESVSKATARLMPVVRDKLDKWVVEGANGNCQRLFKRLVAQMIFRHDVAAMRWRPVLDELASSRPTVVLVNHGARPEGAALAEVCQERGIPVAAFQHGVTREINGQHHHAMAYYENSTSDYFFTYNEASSAISTSSPFATGRCVSIGLPRQYSRIGRFRSRNSQQAPLLYVSTKLYKGNLNMLADCYASDLDIAVQEVAIIEQVLKELPYQVLFKPYPQQLRYSDPDPVLEFVHRATNIEVYKESIDTRYILANYRIVVSACASSTTAWCLISGKPYIFIDQPDRAPLKDEARSGFEEGLFLFDGESSTFHDDLRKFLSRPFEAIEAEWRDKAPARKKLIDEYFGAPVIDPGRKAAEFLMGQLFKGPPTLRVESQAGED